jgi:hypothetical protein
MTTKTITLLATLLLFLNSLSFANSNDVEKLWKLLSTKDSTRAIYIENQSVRVSLKSEGGEPKLIAWEKSPKDEVWILKYYAGTVGTTMPIKVLRQFIIKMPEGKVLLEGAYMYQYPSLKADENAKMNQPQWTWDDNYIRVKDKDFTENNFVYSFKHTVK